MIKIICQHGRNLVKILQPKLSIQVPLEFRHPSETTNSTKIIRIYQTIYRRLQLLIMMECQRSVHIMTCMMIWTMAHSGSMVNVETLNNLSTSIIISENLHMIASRESSIQPTDRTLTSTRWQGISQKTRTMMTSLPLKASFPALSSSRLTNRTKRKDLEARMGTISLTIAMAKIKIGTTTKTTNTVETTITTTITITISSLSEEATTTRMMRIIQRPISFSIIKVASLGLGAVESLYLPLKPVSRGAVEGSPEVFTLVNLWCSTWLMETIRTTTIILMVANRTRTQMMQWTLKFSRMKGTKTWIQKWSSWSKMKSWKGSLKSVGVISRG